MVTIEKLEEQYSSQNRMVAQSDEGSEVDADPNMGSGMRKDGSEGAKWMKPPPLFFHVLGLIHADNA